jgi:hypothetical protein
MTAGEKFLAEYESRVANVRATIKAKARVRDAAPDLLAALKQIVADWDSVDPFVEVPDEINIDGHWNAARAALAKAGEWPTEDDDQ